MKTQKIFTMQKKKKKNLQKNQLNKENQNPSRK
jgi:hypothetical protein